MLPPPTIIHEHSVEKGNWIEARVGLPRASNVVDDDVVKVTPDVSLSTTT